MPKTIVPKERIIKSSRTAKAKKGILQHPAKVQYAIDEEISREDFESLLSYTPPEEAVMTYIDDLEAFAKDLLKENGLDYDDRHSGKIDYLLANGRLGNYDAIIQEKKEDFEPVYFADEILFKTLQMRKHIEKKDLFEALRGAFSIEKTRQDLFIRNHEHELALGSALRKTGRDFRKAKGMVGKGFILVTYLYELHILSSRVKERREKKGVEAAEDILYQSGDGEIVDLDREGIVSYQCKKLEDNNIIIEYNLEGDPEGKYHQTDLTRTLLDVIKNT